MIRRTVAALLVAAAACCASLGVATSAASAASGAPPGTNDAIQQFGSCLASGGRGDLLLLLDTSSSLKTSDAGNDRVAAAQYLLRQLGSFATSTHAKIDVSVAGFDSAYHSGSAWKPLDSATEGELVATVDKYATRNTGMATDYWKALNGARQALADKSGAGDCQALLWFSDGKLDIDPRYDKAPAGHTQYDDAWAQKDLCAPAGVASQLRQQGITTMAVGLGGEDYRLMKGIAEGVLDCGRSFGTHSPGLFVPAANVSSLFVAFDALADPSHVPSIASSDLCVKDLRKCTGVPFVLDPFVSKVTILGVSNVAKYGAALLAPSGRVWKIDSSGTAPSSIGSVKISASRPSGTAAVQISLEQGRVAKAWTGRWKLVFFSSSSGTATSSLRLYDDVTPAWLRPADHWFVGDAQPVTIGLVHDTTQRAIDASTLPANAGLHVTGTIQYADGKVATFADITNAADLAKGWPVPLADAAPGPATVTLSLQYTTAPSGGTKGTTFEPQTSTSKVLIKAPSNYPTLPSTVDFGSGDEVGNVTVNVKVDGSGCVWVPERADVATAPSGVTPKVTSSASSEKACARSTLPLTLSVDKLGTGMISGQVAVATKPADGGSVVSTPVRFTYDLDYPKDVKRFLGLLLAIVAIGVAIPVLLLYLVKWRGAKIPGPTLSVGSVLGKVDESQSFLSSTSMRPQDLRVVPLEGTGRRRVGISPRAELVTRMGLGLTEPGYATVDGVTAVTSSGSASTGRRPARLPLNVQDHWVAILDAADPHAGEVEVVFITDPSAAKLGELLNDARNQLPEYVTRLRRTLPEAAAPTPGQQKDDWGSPSSTSAMDDPWGSSTTQPPSSTGSRGNSGSADDW